MAEKEAEQAGQEEAAEQADDQQPADPGVFEDDVGAGAGFDCGHRLGEETPGDPGVVVEGHGHQARCRTAHHGGGLAGSGHRPQAHEGGIVRVDGLGDDAVWLILDGVDALVTQLQSDIAHARSLLT